MELRNWYREHTLTTTCLLSVIFALTVSNIYVDFSQGIILGLGIDGIANALISVAVRFVISAIALYLIIPLIFYQPPRTYQEYISELKFVSDSSRSQSIGVGLLSFGIYALISLAILLSLGIFTSDPLVFAQDPSDTQLGWLWLVFAINPAIFEEMAFRGVLFTNLEK